MTRGAYGPIESATREPVAERSVPFRLAGHGGNPLMYLLDQPRRAFVEAEPGQVNLKRPALDSDDQWDGITVVVPLFGLFSRIVPPSLNPCNPTMSLRTESN